MVFLKDIVFIESKVEYLGRVPYLHSSKKKLDIHYKEEPGHAHLFTPSNNNNQQLYNNNNNQDEPPSRQRSSLPPLLGISPKKLFTTNEQEPTEKEMRSKSKEVYRNQSWQKSQLMALEKSGESPNDVVSASNASEDYQQILFLRQKQVNDKKKLTQSLQGLVFDHISLLFQEQNYKQQMQQQIQDAGEALIPPSIDPSFSKPRQKSAQQIQSQPQQQLFSQQQTLKIQKVHSDVAGGSGMQGPQHVAYMDRNAYVQEANVSLDERTNWRLVVYSEQIEKDSWLLYGDVIWLNHIESGLTLITRRSEMTNSLYITVDSASKKEQFQKYEGNTNGMWVIEHENFTKGGLISWEDRFFLRNFSSGQYLSMNPHRKNFNQSTFRAIEYPDIFSLFSFTPISMSSDSKSFIAKDSFFFIKAAFQNAWIHFADKKEEEIEAQEDAFVCGYEKGTLILEMKYAQPLDEDAFKVIRATMTEVLEANFLISCFPILRSSLSKLQHIRLTEKQILSNPPEMMELEKKMNLLKLCLEDLDKFCKNRIITTSIEHEASSYGKLNPSRQKVLFEQYYIDIVIALLQELLTEEEMQAVVHLEHAEIKAKIAQKIKACLRKQRKVHIDLERIETQLSMKAKKNGIHFVNNADKFAQLVQNATETQRQNYISYLKLKLSVVKLSYSLLTSICKSSSANEKYLFEKKMREIKYMAKYLKEAVDCIISTISNNEKIINDLCDDIRFAERARRY